MHMCMLKTVMGLPWENCQISSFTWSFHAPLPSSALLRHYVLLTVDTELLASFQEGKLDNRPHPRGEQPF